jgi:hypothetical protein
VYQYAPPQTDHHDHDHEQAAPETATPRSGFGNAFGAEQLAASPPNPPVDEARAGVAAAEARVAGADAAVAAAQVAVVMAEAARATGADEDLLALDARVGEASFALELAQLQRSDAQLAVHVARIALEAAERPALELVDLPVLDGAAGLSTREEALADREARIVAAAATTRAALGGATVSPTQALDAMHGLEGPAEVARFVKACADSDLDPEGTVIGFALDERLEQLSPTDEVEARAHLSGDVVEATKTALRNAVGLLGGEREPDGPRALGLLERLTPAQRLALHRDEGFSGGGMGEVDDLLIGVLPPDALERFRDLGFDERLLDVGDALEHELPTGLVDDRVAWNAAVSARYAGAPIPDWVVGPGGLVDAPSGPARKEVEREEPEEEGFFDALFRDAKEVAAAGAPSEAQRAASKAAGDERCRKALAQLDADTLGDPEQLLQSVQGMNAAEARAFFERMAELEGFEDRDAAREHFERQLAVQLDPMQYGVAMASLDGDRVAGAKAALRRAAADPSFLLESSGLRNGRTDDLTTGEHLRQVSRRLPKAKDFSMTANPFGAAGLAAKFDADEAGMVAILEGLSSAELVELANDESFADQRRKLSDAMDGEGRLKDRWDRLLDTGPRERAIAEVESRAVADALARLPPDADADARSLAAAKATAAARGAEDWEQQVTAATSSRWRGAELAEQAHLALYGANRFGEQGLLDAGDHVHLDLDSDAQRTKKVLDALDAAPADVQASFAKNFVRDLPDELRDKYPKDATPESIVEGELGRELQGHKVTMADLAGGGMGLVWNAVSPQERDGLDAAAAQEQWRGAKTQVAVDQALATVSQAYGGQVSALQVHTWLATVDAGGPQAEQVLRELEDKGVSVTDLEQAAIADRERRHQDHEERALRVAEAAAAKRFDGADGVFALLEDPELAAVDTRIRALTAPGGQLTAPQQLELDGLQHHRAALAAEQGDRSEQLDAAVQRATEGRHDSLRSLASSGVDVARLGTGDGFLDRLDTLQQTGTLPLEDWLYVTTRGAGEDTASLEKRLAGRSPAELEAAGDAFQERYGDEYEAVAGKSGVGVVRALVDDQVSGAAEARLRVMANGDPSLVYDPARNYSASERQERAEERLELERKGLRELNEARDASWSSIGDDRIDRARAATKAMLDDEEKSAALEAGDPAAWKEFLALKQRSTLSLGVAEDAKVRVGDGLKAQSLEAAAELVTLPGISVAAKIGITVGSLLIATGAQAAVQGSAWDGEKAAVDVMKALAKLGVDKLPGKDLHSDVITTAILDVLLDPAALRGGNAADLLAAGILSALSAKWTANVFGDPQRSPAMQALGSGSLDLAIALLPKLMDGTLTWKDVESGAGGVLKGSLQAHTDAVLKWSGTRAELEKKLQELHQTHQGRDPKLNDLEIRLLLDRGISVDELASIGVPVRRAASVNSTNHTLVDLAPPPGAAAQDLARLRVELDQAVTPLRQRLAQLEGESGEDVAIEREALEGEIAARSAAMQAEAFRMFASVPPEEREQVAREYLAAGSGQP